MPTWRSAVLHERRIAQVIGDALETARQRDRALKAEAAAKHALNSGFRVRRSAAALEEEGRATIDRLIVVLQSTDRKSWAQARAAIEHEFALYLDAASKLGKYADQFAGSAEFNALLQREYVRVGAGLRGRLDLELDGCVRPQRQAFLPVWLRTAIAWLVGLCAVALLLSGLKVLGDRYPGLKPATEALREAK